MKKITLEQFLSGVKGCVLNAQVTDKDIKLTFKLAGTSEGFGEKFINDIKLVNSSEIHVILV